MLKFFRLLDDPPGPLTLNLIPIEIKVVVPLPVEHADRLQPLHVDFGLVEDVAGFGDAGDFDFLAEG